MKVIDQYRRFGLTKPIALRPGLRIHLLLWGGGGFLLSASVVAMREGDPIQRAIGAFGALFFGGALAVLIYALANSGQRGLCEISSQGIYMSHIGTTLPWADIGPAWCSVTKHAGGTTKDVVFVLRNASRHSLRMSAVGRILLRLSRRVAHSSPGGGVDWGMRAFMTLTDADESYDQFAGEMERIRRMIQSEPDSTVFNIPVPLRLGVPVEDLIAIINREVASRRSSTR